MQPHHISACVLADDLFVFRREREKRMLTSHVALPCTIRLDCALQGGSGGGRGVEGVICTRALPRYDRTPGRHHRPAVDHGMSVL